VILATGSPGTAVSISPSQTSYNQTGNAGAAAANAPTVTVRDAQGNPVSGVTVAFSVVSGGGTVANATATTNSAGSASSGTWTLGAAAGANSVTATIAVPGSGTAKAIFMATTSTGATTILRVSADTIWSGHANSTGGTWDTYPTAKVVDAGGNPVANVLVTFTSGATLAPMAREPRRRLRGAWIVCAVRTPIGR